VSHRERTVPAARAGFSEHRRPQKRAVEAKEERPGAERPSISANGVTQRASTRLERRSRHNTAVCQRPTRESTTFGGSTFEEQSTTAASGS
jgi:hypothetical protein